MSNEEILLEQIKACAHGIEMNIRCLTDYPDAEQSISGFTDGKIVGLTWALNSIRVTLKMYEYALQVKENGDENGIESK